LIVDLFVRIIYDFLGRTKCGEIIYLKLFVTANKKQRKENYISS